jgi:dTDP-L-rhamnose 4-epimerase
VQQRTCLVTGGAGFIGSEFLRQAAAGYERVIVIDSLLPQVHAEAPVLPDGVTLIVGDVADPEAWPELVDLLRGSSSLDVLHLAAETGTGQSLTEPSRHSLANVVGTTRLTEALDAAGVRPAHVVLASSRAVYGEGAWSFGGEVVYPGQRGAAQLERGEWDFPGAEPLAMRADRVAPNPVSAYGATKLAQEHLLTAWAVAHEVPLTVLRLQNVYGSGQSLTNSYTGILPLFCRMAREGRAIPLYEDGLVRRDFVHVSDVVSAMRAAFAGVHRGVRTLDVGSGRYQTVHEVAAHIARTYGAPEPVVTGEFRHGDVRHAWADTEVTESALEWRAVVGIDAGLDELIAWVDGALTDPVE